MTIKHKQFLELTEPIHFADVEQFVQMGKQIGIKPDAKVSTQYLTSERGYPHTVRLRVGESG